VKARMLILHWSGVVAFAIAGTLALGAGTSAQPIVERVSLYEDGLVAPCTLEPWSNAWEERDGGATPGGRCLWFNVDCAAPAWAGVRFLRLDPEFVLTPEWLENGAARFFINIGLDRHGSIGGGVRLQLAPIVDGQRYQGLRAGFIDGGRGTDEDTATWQEVLIPLSYWTGLRAGESVDGFLIQMYGEATRSFGIDELSFVRYAERPEWLVARESQDVAQPWVRWPEYEDLPECLKADRHPPRVRDGKFVDQDGRRVFLTSPYCREDARLDMWGTTDDTKRPPDHGLYDPNEHGWLYNELPTAQGLCRMGFNTYSATMPPGPFWEATGYGSEDTTTDPARLSSFHERVGLPFYVDMVCWPWTLGSPGTKPEHSTLPATALTEGYNHWTPYRITGEGREVWMTMWRTYAQRYRDAGVPVFIYELMNEPAYLGVSDDHRAAFVEWLKRRYGNRDVMNATWGTDFESWEAVIGFEDGKDLKRTAGAYLDYDEFLAELYTDLIADGIEAIREIDPDALAGVQTMGGFALSPRESVWKHRFTRFESVMLTPTGGGRWSPGASGASARDLTLDGTIAGAPLEGDLLLALAGERMIFDNETYTRGETGLDVRNRLWEHVVAGLDGLTVFSWSKRGWIWWKSRDVVRTEADKFPYCNLNPFARRTETLRGILDFSREVQPLADRILRKPWGPAPRIGLLYDWAQARRRAFEGKSWDKTAHYHAALRYTHWNLAMAPSDRAIDGALDNFEVLVVGGVSNIEPEMLPVLESFVERGGVLIIGEEPFADLYDRPLATDDLFGVQVGEPQACEGEIIALPEALSPDALPGQVRLTVERREVVPLPGTQVLVRSDAGAPVVTRVRRGDGLVYFQAADVVGYPLAKLLWAIFRDAAVATGHDDLPEEWRLAEIRDAATGQLSANMLLSRRSHERYHALLLMNRDRYDKSVDIRLGGLEGAWRVTDGLTDALLDGPDGGPVWSAGSLAQPGVRLAIPGGHPAVLLIERNE
jgi:hypothetical protein